MDAVEPCRCWCKGDVSLSTEGILGDLSSTPEEEDVAADGVVVADLCATFSLHGARGEYAGVGGWNILPSAPVATKKKSDDGGGIGISSQDEALEEAAVGTVGEAGGRPGPHPKPS